MQETAEVKALLSKKAAEVKIQREKEWDVIFHRTHPEPLRGSAAIRVRRVRTRFLQSGSGGNVSRWEREIHDAVREAAMVASNILKNTNRPPFSQYFSRLVPPPVVSNPPEKSIESLIAQQGPPLASRPTVEKRKGKNKGNNTEG
jgi:oxalate---CoA ligase